MGPAIFHAWIFAMINRSTFLRSFAGALALASAAWALGAADSQPATPALAAPPPLKDIRIVVHTGQGDIAGTLYAGKAPMTVANFLNLAKTGFYDGLTFHRVEDFMIQGGDPDGNSTGGPGYRFADEIDPSLKFAKPGVFAMANAGPNTNGSQFFITHLPSPWLDGHYNIFGQVTDGQDVVNKIAKGEKIIKIEILDPTDDLFAAQAANLAKWNAALKARKG
jgi:peptidyl-prolyl cis-trans isomerase B (cyclophilin B)